MIAPSYTRRWLRAAALALGLSTVPLSQAIAAPKCLDTSNQCEPDKLCTFRVQLAEKVFLYQMYLKNSQVTKAWKVRDTIAYDGTMYDASVMEARRDFPDLSDQEQMVRAGQIFQEKLRKYAAEKFKPPKCRLNGTMQSSMLPKEGYDGMFTNQYCQVRVSYNRGDYDAAGFGANDMTSCQEFYDRDRAHEIIHQRSCQAARGQNRNLDGINEMIEDEVAAYEHSVRLSLAYVRLLSLRCSAQPNPTEQQKRAERLEQLLAPYIMRGN